MASRRARKIFGQGVLISVINYGIQCFIGHSEEQFSKLRVLYNDCTRAMYGVSKKQKVSLSVMRKKLGILSFDALTKFFDITTLARILNTRSPHHLAKYLEISNREARGSYQGWRWIIILDHDWPR